MVGSSGHVVKWWQTRCNEILGHAKDVDGLYGNVSRHGPAAETCPEGGRNCRIQQYIGSILQLIQGDLS